jgi:predicted NUDIX family phosphoesterase
VLVVPSTAIEALGSFEGFLVDRRYFATLAEATLLERAAAEVDESHRQIIPYLVLSGGGTVFSYARTERGGEQRLHGRRSIGVGGHVNAADLPGGLGPLTRAPEAGLIAAARRELVEETVGADDATLRWLGFIRDQSSAVARVHFGVVFAAAVDPSRARLSDEGAMTDARFSTIAALAAERHLYERWSQLVLDYLAGHP